MLETFNNILEVTSERGDLIKIRVFDILDENLFNKTFIIYALANDENSIFASVLNEGESDYSLDSITSSDELNYINNEIDMIMNEIEEAQWT